MSFNNETISKISEEDFKLRRGEMWDGVPGFIRHYRSTANKYEPGLPSLRTTYVAPYIAPKVQKSKSYTDNMICTTHSALENLRFTKRQLAKDDRELQKLQKEINELTSRRRVQYTDDDVFRSTSSTPDDE